MIEDNRYIYQALELTPFVGAVIDRIEKDEAQHFPDNIIKTSITSVITAWNAAHNVSGHQENLLLPAIMGWRPGVMIH